jgi:hypothetical protein
VRLLASADIALRGRYFSSEYVVLAGQYGILSPQVFLLLRFHIRTRKEKKKTRGKIRRTWFGNFASQGDTVEFQHSGRMTTVSTKGFKAANGRMSGLEKILGEPCFAVSAQ